MLLHAKKTILAWRMSCYLALMLLQVVGIFGQSPTRSFEISGVVRDPHGAVIADAKVILRRQGSDSPETRIANQRGEFSFMAIVSGKYEIEVRRDGFKPNISQLAVGTKAPPLLRIVRRTQLTLGIMF